MSVPLEVFAGPFTAWLAPITTTAETEPTDLGSAPDAAYLKLGARGSDNYDEDGVVFSHEEVLEYFRGLGTTGRQKAWRTEEDPSVQVTVYDLTPDAWAIATGNAKTTVAAAAGVSGGQKVDLLKGHSVDHHTLLLRSDFGSPLGDAFVTQLWIPRVVIDTVDEVTFKKGEPGGLAFTFEILEDATSGFGNFHAQSAAAS